MELYSVEFLAFLLITLLSFNLVNGKYRWIILTIASIFFIYSFSLRFLIITAAFAIVNYLIGIAIYKSRGIIFKNAFYQLGIWLNIGMLVFYKYFNFLTENIFRFFGKYFDVDLPPALKLIIPLGISFYVFQSIGYLIDVKRGTKPAETNPGKFILFIIYFPKFISGPVERTNNLLPQINLPKQWDDLLFREGLMQMLWGYYKTAVISDRLSVFVTAVNSNIADSSEVQLLTNFFIQFLYLYFNFSGYTDIVIGISKLFGINLIKNFNRPFFATSVSDYWRRWHISLTTWCNDYIFKRIILKRMRWGKWASIYGVFITFLIIGIWHGASWNFVILGLLQGIAINFEYFTKKKRLEIGGKIPIWLNLTISRISTLVFICFSHVFFYTNNLKDAILYFSGMFKGTGSDQMSNNMGLQFKDIIILSIGFIIILVSEYRDETGKKSIKSALLDNKYLYWIVLAIAVVTLLITGISKSTGFIYEQF